MARCPVCDTEYSEGQNKYCSTCGWNLTLNLPTDGSLPIYWQQKPDELKQIEEWARKIWARKTWNEKNSESSSLINISYFKLLQSKLNQANKEEIEVYKLQVKEAYKKLSELESKLQQSHPDNDIEINFLEESKGEKANNISSEKIQKLLELLKNTIERVSLLEQSEKKHNGILQQIKVQLDKTQNTTEADREEFENWKQGIEGKIENIEKSQLFTDSSAQTSSVPQFRETQTQPEDIILTSEENYIVKNYQNYPSNLPPRDATEVNATEDSINDYRLGGQKVILTKIQRGNYWIINQGGFAYLVPKKNLKFNQYSYNTAEALFECKGYQSGYSRNFQLLKPARVSESPEGEKWQLEEKGILIFQ